MPASATTDYGALSGLERLIGFIVSLATAIFVSWVRKDRSGVASSYVGQAQKISIVATAVFLVISWGFWANSSHLRSLSVAAGIGVLICFVFFLLNIWIVEESRSSKRTAYVVAFIASYVIYTFAGSSGLSASGLFATVVLSNPANTAAAVTMNSYEVVAVLQGTRDVIENQIVPFRATSGQVNVDCNQTAAALVHWRLPAGARVEGSVQPRWEQTDNVKQVNAPPAASVSSDGVVSAQGTIMGLDRQNFAFGISNCPGGGHGQLVISGQYIASATHSAEQPPVALNGELNSHDRTVILTVPNSPDFHVTSCSVRLSDKQSKKDIDSIDLPLTVPQSSAQQKSSRGRFSVTLSGQNLKIDLLE
jgi:hypothetical protein